MTTLKYLKPAGTANFKDSGITKVNEIFVNWDGEKSVDGLGLVGLPLSKSSISHSGGSFSPATIRKCFSSFTTYSIEDDQDLADYHITDFGDVEMHVTNITDSQTRIEETLTQLFTEHPNLTPIILGGDHSITAPSFKALTKSRNGRVGIIQFDAHHDLRNLQDGGPSNGTPFRNLIDSGVLQGENLFQIGIRSFSNGKTYTSFARESGVTIYSMDDIREKGILPIVKSCLEKLKSKVDYIYISLDMDVMDQAFAPGCPAIGPDGMDTPMIKQAIQYISRQPEVIGLDIVEIDPTLDYRDMTSRLAAYLLLTFISGYKER
ncbi:formimidoylglutamase [Bacillus salitolerans]|uniref:Formimidoylglutamase n=1 Tax=Bacillus salitolerans TaxID=1437434 RepID=A0ABW4LQ10_9BACI